MTGEFRRGVVQADLSHRQELVIDAALVADLPLEANVQNCTVLATEMPFIGRAEGP